MVDKESREGKGEQRTERCGDGWWVSSESVIEQCMDGKEIEDQSRESQ